MTFNKAAADKYRFSEKGRAWRSSYQRTAKWRESQHRSYVKRSVAVKAQYRRRKYGIEPSQYDAMLAAQGGACAICREFRRLEVDHDHFTGEVRGLLCGQCNTRLAALDDAPWMVAARAYLE